MSNKLKLAAGATIDKAIEAIVKASASLGPDIHKWGVQAMMHAAEHGDARKVDRLFKGLHGANAPEAFKDWVMEYSPIRWNGDGEVGILKSTAKLFKPFNIEGANGNPYWNRIAVQKQPLTLDKLLKLISGMSKKIDKAETRLDFHHDAEMLERQVRAFAPSPGAWFELEGERCRVLAAEAVNRAGAAGEVLDDQLTIACGFGALRPTLVQRAGRPVMDTASLLRGKPVSAGTVLR